MIEFTCHKKEATWRLEPPPSPGQSSHPKLFSKLFYYTAIRVGGAVIMGADASLHIFAYGRVEGREDISQLKCLLSVEEP